MPGVVLRGELAMLTAKVVEGTHGDDTLAVDNHTRLMQHRGQSRIHRQDCVRGEEERLLWVGGHE